MFKPKFNPPTRKHLPLERTPFESFEQYKVRRAAMNRMVKRINADAPGRRFQFTHGGLGKANGDRSERVGKGKHVFGEALQRHFDDLRYTDWLPRHLNRMAPKMDMDWARTVRSVA